MALTKASLAVAPSMFRCPASSAVSLGRIGRGGVTFARLPPWSALAAPTPSPVSAERLRQAAE